jgi:uncharacterized repeat protein (TIGR03803 family)
MNARLRKFFLLPKLIAALGLIMTGTGRGNAQNFTNLYNFLGEYQIVSDGNSPVGDLVLSGNTLYGMTQAGGANGAGTLFSIHTDGSGYTNFYNFNFAGPDGGYPNGSGGGNPYGGLIVSGGTLYGTTSQGSSDNGTVFAIKTDGTGYTNLYRFVGTSLGSHPQAGLVLAGNTLYGTTYDGGSNNDGTVFSVNTDSTGFTNLHNFAYDIDGGNPQAGLVLSGNTLYGTTSAGGAANNGTVFAIGTNGKNFASLYAFTNVNDGATPEANLIISGSTLYGTAFGGGTGDVGTVFAIRTNGLGYTNLYTFSAGAANEQDNTTNSDGAGPRAGLLLLGNTLYGTANQGGLGGVGTIFAVNTDGSDFTNLYNFTEPDPNTFTNTDGGVPWAGLILSGSTLYGTTSADGFENLGTVYGLSVTVVTLPGAPLLNILRSGANVVLSWPANATGFNLEFATNLVSPVWNLSSPAPSVVGTNNAVTNGISGKQRFYRLSQ